MPELSVPQRTEQWLNARKGRITASLAAACLGMDPFKGPLAAYNEIIGSSSPIDNKHVRWGLQFESEALLAYQQEYGHFVEETGFWVHDLYPWLGASPDGLVGDDGLVEVKCPSVLPEAIPFQHWVQCVVQLACTNRQWVDYFVWVKPNHFLYRVQRTEAKMRDLLDKLYGWYQQHVVTMTPPPRRRRRTKLPETVAGGEGME